MESVKFNRRTVEFVRDLDDSLPGRIYGLLPETVYVAERQGKLVGYTLGSNGLRLLNRAETVIFKTFTDRFWNV